MEESNGLINDYRELIGRAKTYLDQEKRKGRTSLPAGQSSRKKVKSTVTEPWRALETLYQKFRNCQSCPLSSTRINLVFGEGKIPPELLFVGEGPGYEEDRQGRPFVGRAGQLLERMIIAMGYRREDVYIANIVKCHPLVDPAHPEQRGNDRPPSPEEITACFPILQKQLAILTPRVIITLGTWAARTLLGTDSGISQLRGRSFRFPKEQLPSPALAMTWIVPTYHPAALLRNPNLKKASWDDLQLAQRLLKNAAIPPA